MKLSFGTALVLGLAMQAAQAQNETSVPAGPELSGFLQIHINEKRTLKGDVGWTIFPGHANRLEVALPARGPKGSFDVTLTRLQPDGVRAQSSVTLDGDAPRASLDLGAFAVPVQFTFEAGVLYRTGARIQLEIRDRQSDRVLEVLRFYQGIDPTNTKEILAPGDRDRVPHFGWRPPSSRPLDPPILLWLAPEVLSDRDNVRVCVQLRPRENLETSSKPLSEIAGRLKVTALTGGEVRFEKDIKARSKKNEIALPVSQWPEGRYRIEIVPEIPGTADRGGPAVVYFREAARLGEVRLSPLAPWSFEGDPSRPELTLNDFRSAAANGVISLPQNGTWTFVDAGRGKTSLVCASGDWREPPAVIRPGLSGCYAVFATTVNGYGYLRVGKQGVVRGLQSDPAFVDVGDLTGEAMEIFPAAMAGAGIRELRFVPVTKASVEKTLRITSNPPVPLRGIADWGVYFFPPPWHQSGGGRLGPDQLDAVLQGHAELGLRNVAWAVGRSWIDYHSRLADTTRFPTVPLEKAPTEDQRLYSGRAFMVNSLDPYTFALERGRLRGVQVVAWLAMQNHYGNVHGGIFMSEWFRSHPEWRRWNKGVSRASDKAVSYYFPEVRKERVDILCEVAERNPDGLLVDWCRQTPIMLYDPKMVAEYRSKTGVDPLKIDASNAVDYQAWIRWRAGFVTDLLRELKSRLAAQRTTASGKIPVAVRIPSKGLFYNLAQGLDVEAWCREQLIDEIQVDPLEECNWRGEPHDIRPYVGLARKNGLPVYGGINGDTLWNYPAILRRALGLAEAGVTGIELYESSNFACIDSRRWLIPLLGNPEQIRFFLANSNLEACYPIWSRNACAGYDNHSFRSDWSVYGLGPSSL